jgi:dienelactone hydrolase
MKTYTPCRTWKLVISIGSLFLLLLTLSIYLQLKLPEPTGPYTVGRTIFRWVDASRPEVMTAERNDVREVMAFVWYPTIQGTGRSAGYFPGLSALAGTLSESGEVSGWEVLGLRLIRSNSPLDAQPVDDQGPFPVLVLLPGNATNIEFYSSLASEIASHGYIVVGLNHPYDVPAVALSDGTVAPYDSDQWTLEPTAHQVYIAERHKVKVADVFFAVEQLEDLNAETSRPFAGLLDLDSLAVAGHSLGGIVASDVCKADARFRACINFDGIQKGGPFSMDETALAPGQPFLFLTKESQLHPKLIQSFEATTESYWVVIHGASHESFTDGPVLRPALLPIPNRDDRMMHLIQQYALMFLEKTLKGKPAGILSQPTEQDEISVRVFPTQQ